MDETPNDSGDSPVDPVSNQEIVLATTAPSEPNEAVGSPASTSRSELLAEQIRRPAVWGLLVLIAVVLVVQIWLLYF